VRQLRPPENPVPVDQPLPGEESDRAAHLEYVRSLTPKPPKRHIGLWIAIIVLLLGIAGGVYYWFGMRKAPTKSVASSKQSAAQTVPTPDANAPIKTKHFDSTSLSLGFDYPDTWTVTDDGNGKITVKSPALELAGANAQKTDTQITVTMQPKQANIDVFKNGNAVAVLDSQKIAYTKPSQNQRAQTYLSFLQYVDTTTDGLDAIYVTGDFGYQKGQAIPLVDVSKADPLITVTFAKCSDAHCGGTPTAATLAATDWGTTTYLAKVVQALLTSLVVQ